MKPDRKVAAGGVGGALATIVIWVADLAGVDMPGQVAAAVVVIAMFAVSYGVRSSGSDGESGEATVLQLVAVGYLLMVVGLLSFRGVIELLA